MNINVLEDTQDVGKNTNGTSHSDMKLSVGERRTTIMRVLDATCRVAVGELSQMTRVSDMTVRRDLEALEHEGLLKRTRGGAESVASLGCEHPYSR